MRTRIILLLAALAACYSCSWLEEEEDDSSKAVISTSFVSESYLATKASFEVPDTSDFTLSVTRSDGKVIYSGAYGASPEQLLVSAGTYTVKAVSGEFPRPAFDSPQYGDEQCVVVRSGESAKVKLMCVQLNAGMRLKVSPSFLTAYPKGLLYLKSNDGKLLWAYRESRTAFFKPGAVSLILSNEGVEKTLLSRTLMSQDMFVLSVSATAPTSGQSADKGGISIAVDTTRHWSSGSFVIGGSGSSSGTDEGADNALGVGEVKSHSGEEDVWVCGYIVGGDLSSSATGIKFSGPFSSETNIALAARSSVSSKSSCISIQLPSGDVREALNLVTNPENLGRKVFVKGDIVSSYYGLPGVKNVTEYRF